MRVLSLIWLLLAICIFLASVHGLLEMLSYDFFRGRLFVAYIITMLAATAAGKAGLDLWKGETRYLAAVSGLFLFYFLFYLISWEEGAWQIRVALPLSVIMLCICSIIVAKRGRMQ